MMVVQQQGEEKSLDLEQLRKQLESKKTEEIAVAEAHLQRLAPQELIKLIGIEARARKKRKKQIIYVIIGYIVFMLTLGIITHQFGQLWMFGNMIGAIAGAAAFKPGHKKAAQQLAKYDDVAAVGPLVESLEMRDDDVHVAVKAALTRLLPVLRASDSHLLNNEQRRILLGQLNTSRTSKNWEITISMYLAALKALEQVGDASFIPLVESFSAGKAAGVDSRVRDAAIVCLPHLKQRAEYERASHQLLRASAPDRAHDASILLRPAEDAGESKSGELLRPSSSLEEAPPV